MGPVALGTNMNEILFLLLFNSDLHSSELFFDEMLSLLELTFLHTRHGLILIYVAFHVKTLRQTSVVEGAAHLLAVEEPLEEQGSESSAAPAVKVESMRRRDGTVGWGGCPPFSMSPHWLTETLSPYWCVLIHVWTRWFKPF